MSETEYMRTFKDLLLKYQQNYPKRGKCLYVSLNELQEIVEFVSRMCKKAEMYDVILEHSPAPNYFTIPFLSSETNDREAKHG